MVICSLCKSSEKDDVNYGEFLQKGRVSVHYYCLLLTTVMEQNGQDHEGIRGFLLPDIKECAEKSANKKCTYCRGTGANIACCNRKCFRYFHTTCGANNNARYIFYDTFQSFCHRHIDLPNDSVCHDPEEDCAICCMSMGAYHPLKSIRTPCCSSGWFHRECLARCALSAGYFFRCPLCNDDKTFREFLINRNVFIPDRDASWEMAPQAFSELERAISCSADECRCPTGRTTNASHWKMRICKICGSAGIHMNCNKYYIRRRFTCPDCDQMLKEIGKQKSGETSSGNEEPEMPNVEPLEPPVEIVQKPVIETPLNDISQRRVLRSRSRSFFQEMSSCLETIPEMPSLELPVKSKTPAITRRKSVSLSFNNNSIDYSVTPSSSASTATLDSMCNGNLDEPPRKLKKHCSENQFRRDPPDPPKPTLRSRSQSMYEKRPGEVKDVAHNASVDGNQQKRRKSISGRDRMKLNIFTEPERRSDRLRKEMNSCLETPEMPSLELPVKSKTPAMTRRKSVSLNLNNNSIIDYSVTESSSSSTATLNSTCSEKSIGNLDEPSRKLKKHCSESQFHRDPPKTTLRSRSQSMYAKRPEEAKDAHNVSENERRRKTMISGRDRMKMNIFTEPERRSGRLRKQEIAIMGQNWQKIVLPVPETTILNNRNRPCRRAAIHSRILTQKMTGYFEA